MFTPRLFTNSPETPGLRHQGVPRDGETLRKIFTKAEMAVQGYEQLDINTIQSYVMNLRKLLDENEVAQRKAFLRSFIKKIVVDKNIVK